MSARQAGARKELEARGLVAADTAGCVGQFAAFRLYSSFPLLAPRLKYYEGSLLAWFLAGCCDNQQSRLRHCCVVDGPRQRFGGATYVDC